MTRWHQTARHCLLSISHPAHDIPDLLSCCSVVPVHYTIFLRCLARPARKFDYDGEVTIELDIKSDTKEIVLNTIELKILSAELTSENDLTQQASISYQDPVQRTVFAFDKTVNGKAILMIRFEGNINGVGYLSFKSIVVSLKAMI